MASRLRRLIRFQLPQRLVARYMESKIPLPTDNIYKFGALLSLILFISGFGLVTYATNSSNAIVFEHWVELETLQTIEKPTTEQQARLKSLERKVEVAVSDKNTYKNLAFLMILIGTCGALFGFGYWLKHIQPVADQMAKTQLEIARLQLLNLRADLKAKGIDVDTV